MQASCPIPQNESARLKALLDLHILDTPPEEAFEQITEIAAAACQAPMAVITLLDERRQWFKSRRGLQVTQTPREVAFCAHAIMGTDLMVVEDATKDERFFDNPLVTGAPHIRFYAGVALVVSGQPVGTLAVLDTVPRTLSPEQARVLKMVARHCVQQLESRRFAFSRREMLEGVLDASPLAIILLDTKGYVISWNKSAERIFGWRASEVINRPYPAVPPGGEGDFQRTLAGMMNGTEYQFDTRRQRKDGTTFPARVWAAATRDQRGTVVGAVVLIEDLTRQQLIENRLLQLGAAVSASEDAIISHDLAGTIQSWAGATEKIYGYSAEEVLGRSVAILLPADCRAKIAEAVSRTRRGESFTRSNAQHVRKDGRLINVSVTFTPLRDSSGEITGLCAVVRDLTAQTLVEQQLAQSQKMEAVGRLAGGVAHDFNNMLGVILGYAELAELSLPQDSPIKQNLQMIKSTAMRSADLTRHLLAFSRKQVLRPAVLDLDEVLAESQKMIARVIGEDIELGIDLHAHGGRVHCDRSQLQQVLLNLAVNARDAMPSGGLLRIQTRSYMGQPAEGMPNSHYCLISVSDTGIGMDAATREHIFEPFFTTKEAGKGTGLGLSIVHGIVEQSGGHLSVQSEPGVGTTFDIYLPEATQQATEPAQQEVNHEPNWVARGSVLLVEDELLLRQIVAERLRARGFTVHEFENGEEALHAALHRKLSFDVLVTDVVMPKVNGTQLAHELRRNNSNLKVLYMSGYADGVLEASDIREQNASFIAKPFTASQLCTALDGLLNGDHAQSHAHPAPPPATRDCA